MLADRTVREYTASLASDAPAPGGGSAAALVGALACALAEMTANFTVGREKFAQVEGDIRDLLTILEQQRARLLELTDEDAVAYTKVKAAYAMPRKTDEEKAARSAAVQEALQEAARVPSGVCEACAAVVYTLADLAEKGNQNLISDVGCAARLALAAMECGWLNAEINFASITDEEYLEASRTHLFETIMPAAEEAGNVWQAVVDRFCEDTAG